MRDEKRTSQRLLSTRAEGDFGRNRLVLPAGAALRRCNPHHGRRQPPPMGTITAMQPPSAPRPLPILLRLATVALAIACGPTPAPTPANAAEPKTPAIYDEAAVPPYALPELLVGPDGAAITTADDWLEIARPHHLETLERFIYGRRLPEVPVTPFGEVERTPVTLPGDVPAVRVQARLRLGATPAAPTVDVLLYLPKATQPVPVFLELNFQGNHAQHPDRGIRLTTSWLPRNPRVNPDGNQATDASRGACTHRWPVEQMLSRGYGMATAYYGDIYADRPDGRAASALAALGRPLGTDLPADEPNAIAAWAWGLSRILDWLVTLPEVDPTKVIVVGHSRLGKAALWAGGCDERFAMVVSNESGCGGAALSRRIFGETVADITRSFPHWFCPAFAAHANREAELPCDQHTLLALVAPRPLYVSSAAADRWADPRGEFLATVAAEPVWKLFGLTGLGTDQWPPIDTPIGKTIGYHVRSGGHDLIDYDWQRFADFADHTLRDKAAPAADGYPAFLPVQAPLPVKPPPGAILLFGDGTEAKPPKFTSMTGGPINWPIRDGALVVQPGQNRTNHILSTVTFRDADIHVEFMVSPVAKGNSGLYIHGHYEMQIQDSFGKPLPDEHDEGSLYRYATAATNAARPAGEWQVYDVRFIAPRRDAGGTIVKHGSITAWLNGACVQNGTVFTDPRSPHTPYKYGVTDHVQGVEKRILETGTGPLFLQEHDSPTRFRNVWVLPLGPR